MLFNSMQFMLFFPLVTLVYFVIPQRIKYLWLLAASYYFYMCWNAKYALLIATSTLITYASGLLISGAGSNRRMARFWVGLSFGSNLAILFFFKYWNFALDTVTKVFALAHIELNLPLFDVLLPVGISFYTFQALSYTMDVYRKEIEPERNLLKYALFVSFFPQLVAGPIERSKNLLLQISEQHSFDARRVKSGLLLMLWGLFEKMVIADRAAIYVDQVFNHYSAYGSVELVTAAILFAVQIYCDFGGYSHIAIGSARVMGFRLMENFRQPYFARNIQDFWRRWHISLSTWFRDYLYIPLGGSRCSRLRGYFNVMITFLASGLWHGASWNFVAWGGLHGAYQIIGKQLRPVRERAEKKLHVRTDTFGWNVLRCAVTFVLTDIAWVFFRAPGCTAALEIFAQMVTRYDPWKLVDGSLFLMGLPRGEFQILLCAILLLFLIDLLREKKFPVMSWLENQPLYFRWILYIGGLICVFMYGVYGGAYNAARFIYFQF